MDLSSCIREKKNNLKPTKTVITNEVGKKFEIFKGVMKDLNTKGLPFIVDEKPDLQIVTVLSGLFISSQDPVYCSDILKRYNIKHILSLGIDPAIKFDEITYHYVEILDMPQFDIKLLLNTCINIINMHRYENILVHCNAGVSRSPTIVIGYLMTHENLTYDDAYNHIKTKRNCIQPNDGFVRQLKILESEQKFLTQRF